MTRTATRCRYWIFACAVSATLFACTESQRSGQPSKRSEPAQVVPRGTLPASDDDAIQVILNAGNLDAVRIDGDSQLLVVAIDNNELQPELIGRPKVGIAAADAMTDPDIRLVIGSGFVSELHSLEPVGLLQVEGRELSELQRHGYTRVLGFTDQAIGVVHKQAFQRGLFANALQVGPGIVEQGELDISEADLKRPKYFRSFVAICGDQTLVGISTVPTNLRTLGQDLLRHLDSTPLQCDEVVNLAGDRQALLAVRDGARVAYHGDPTTYKVSLIAFRTVPLAVN